jgi:hypothetical protein
LNAEPLAIQVTPMQMIGFSDRLLQQGKPEEALQVLDLLSHDPDGDIRNEARFRRAKLLEARGSTANAAALLRQIVDERPGATAVRLQLAQLLDRMGNKDGAWRQVRAAQAAGLPLDVARIVDRYSDALRAARPMGASVEVAIAPDSNISQATRSDTLGTVIGDFTIGKESQAKSGLGLSVRGQAFRRIPIGSSGALVGTVSGLADVYRRSRFNDLVLDVAAGPEFEVGRNSLHLEIGATQRWYGQRPYLRSVRLAGVASRPIDSSTRLWLRASASLVDNRLNGLEDGKSYSAKLSVERALSTTMGVSISIGGSRNALRDAAYSTTSWRLGGLVWRDFGRSTLTAELEAGRLRADDRLVLFPTKREDRSFRLTIGATMRQFGFAGFAPVTRIVIERNRSTIAFYDYRRTRTEFALVRPF